MLQIGLAVLHLVALAIGLPAIVARARALGRAATETGRGDALRRAFEADTAWGLAAMLWIGTGLWRYLAGTEMSTGYYNRNHLFLAKMSLLALVLLLEIWPMVTLIRWRIAVRGGAAPDVVATPRTARRIASVSRVQCALVLLMVIFAVGMARGFGAMPAGIFREGSDRWASAGALILSGPRRPGRARRCSSAVARHRNWDRAMDPPPV